MKTFKRKTFNTAVLAALGVMGAMGTASAVTVNPDGLGQALIYPYFTTRSGAGGGNFNTYLSVVNTTASTKAIKVRFLEGKNSREVLDFNVYLSPFDVWTAAVVPSTDGSGGSKMVTSDNSCMVPSVKELPFVNYAYSGTAADGEVATLDRTNEGYFEILEMGEMIGTITTGLMHTAAGVPANCAVLGGTAGAVDESRVLNAVFVNGVNTNNGNVKWGTGGLAGSGTLINPTTGAAFGYDPVVLDAWNNSFSVWTSSGSITPDLSFSFPAISKLFDGNRTVITDWTTSASPYDAVSAVLMHDNLINEFILDAGTKSRSDWVVTFPTKRGYVGKDPLSASGARLNTAAIRPFQSNFWTGGSCDTIVASQFDREEARAAIQVIPSPPPPGPTQDQLCWEANVISFVSPAGGVGTSNILGSTNARTIQSKYVNGWVNVQFPTVAAVPTAHRIPAPLQRTLYVTSNSGVLNTQTTVDATYFGLPVVGFGLETYTNTAVGGSAYGARLSHKYTRLITP